MKILIVEDNVVLSNNIAKYLELEGIESTQLFEGKNVPLELVSCNYDLMILDLGLPDIDGTDLCSKIRESGKDIPVLILTARNTVSDKIKGFNCGADDFVTKPFDYEELLLRIRAIIKRNFSVKSEIVHLDNDLQLDIKKKKLLKSDSEIHLSKLEIDLLIYLVQNKSRTISKDELLEKVWGEYDDFKVTRTVDVYIGYLRKKIDKDLIKTVRGIGYLID